MAKHQRAPWGCVQRARQGVYRIRYWADERDGKGWARHSRTVRGTRQDAQRALSAAMLTAGERRPTATVSECVERFWRPECAARIERGDLRPKTYENYETILRAHILPRWGDVKVSEIEPLDWQEWLLTRTESIGGRCQVVMRAILRLARLYRLCDENVASESYRTSGEVRPQSRAVWPLAECDEMAREARGTVLEVPILLSAFGSMRVGEACGVRLDACDVVEVGGMTVFRADVRGQLLKGKAGFVDYTKTDSSARWCVVPEPWSLRLAEIAGEKAAAGLVWLNDRGDGEPVSRATIQKKWTAAFADGEALSGHEWGPMRNLRASWRTNLRSEPIHMDRDLLEKMMGHSGKGVGEVHYYRPDVEVFSEAVAEAFRGLNLQEVPPRASARRDK